MTVTRTNDTRNSNVVKADVLSNGYFVSTVFLNEEIAVFDSFLGLFPLDDRADLSTPGDYETMVFACNSDGVVSDWTELDFRRYSTEKEAIDGHEKIVEIWMNIK